MKCCGHWEAEHDLIMKLGIEDIELGIGPRLYTIAQCQGSYSSPRVMVYTDQPATLAGLHLAQSSR